MQDSSLEIAWTRIVADGEIAGERVVPFFPEGEEGMSIDYPDDFERPSASPPSVPSCCPRSDGSRDVRRGAAIELRYVGPDALSKLRAIEDPWRARRRWRTPAGSTRSARSWRRARDTSASFSVMDVLAWLHLEVLRDDDVCFSSKGHDAPAVYAVLAAMGELDFELLHRLRRLGGLPGHPDIAAVDVLPTNTGSLGMGDLEGKGFARAARLGRARRVFVICGDGELQEGQFWESLGQAANEGFGEICVIVDHNKIQSDTWVAEVSDLGDLEAKVRAFGWAVARCDGNDVAPWARPSAPCSSIQSRSC